MSDDTPDPRVDEDAERLAYAVEIDDQGCLHCGTGGWWTVMGPNETAISSSYHNKDDAEYIADLMNAAYEKGCDSRDTALREAREERERLRAVASELERSLRAALARPQPATPSPIPRERIDPITESDVAEIFGSSAIPDSAGEGGQPAAKTHVWSCPGAGERGWAGETPRRLKGAAHQDGRSGA